jgi:predicted O-linked N-acetylglucosamine transferase (SPINDLY family)
LIRSNPLTRTKHKQAWDAFNAQQWEQAKALYRQICERDRLDGKAWTMLGMIHGRLNALEDAEGCLQQALRIDPDSLDALTNLGLVFHCQGKSRQAIDSYRKVLGRQPGHVDTLFALGNACAHGDLLTQAQQCYEQVLQQSPCHSGALSNLANVLAYQGRAVQALACYRRALNGSLHGAGVHSNLLLCLHYPLALDSAAIFDENLAWAAQYERNTGLTNDCIRNQGRDRKLRIGYVTPDVSRHSVAYFFEPLLAHPDRSRFETYCYVESASPDFMAKRLWQLPDFVRNTTGQSDEKMVAMIREDRIDILVDLAGHTEQNLLPVFARKPAPVQITYLGYPDTTGLRAMDYRLTDAWADPPGMTEQWHTEKLVRLDDGFLCFTPPDESPEITPLPANECGYVTFGSFNVLTKITDEMLGVWARVLLATPNARLLIKNKQLTDVALQARLYSQFEQLGVARERVDLLGRTSKEEHMAMYGKVDIALDTYPYHGTTTTCDSLWMGIPVITRAGTSHVSRVGVSLLTRIGLGRLVADDDQDYIDRAVRLASDLAYLNELRHGLRNMMNDSGLCDGAAFTHQIEKTFGQLWEMHRCDDDRMNTQ